MSSLALTIKYMIKEKVSPRLHHLDFEQYMFAVSYDIYQQTHSFDHVELIDEIINLRNQF